jgi:hypothetical protein
MSPGNNSAGLGICGFREISDGNDTPYLRAMADIVSPGDTVYLKDPGGQVPPGTLTLMSNPPVVMLW